MKTVIACLITAIVVAAGLILWHNSKVAELEKQLRLATVTEENRTETINDLRKNLEKHKKALEEKEADRRIVITDHTKRDIYKIYNWVYSVQDNADLLTTSFYIKIPDSLLLLEKLRVLADGLSRYRFRNLPVDVLRIENRDGKKVAIVQLKESKYGGRGWAGGFFEGSSGGGTTSVTLKETFLQRDYTGDWIDGVEFHYEGEHALNTFDHVKPLYRASYREETNK